MYLLCTLQKLRKKSRAQEQSTKKFLSLKWFALTRRTVTVEDFSYLNKIRSNAEVFIFLWIYNFIGLVY